jgi:hypothetical protein
MGQPVPPLSPSLPGSPEGGGAFLAAAFLIPAFFAGAFLAEADGDALRVAALRAAAFLAGALPAAFFAGALAGAFAVAFAVAFDVALDVAAFAVVALAGGVAAGDAFVVAAVAVVAVAPPGSLATDDGARFDSADDPGRCGAGSGVDCCCRMNRSSAWTEAPSSTTTPTRRNSRRLTAPEANPRRPPSTGPRAVAPTRLDVGRRAPAP